MPIAVLRSNTGEIHQLRDLEYVDSMAMAMAMAMDNESAFHAEHLALWKIPITLVPIHK
ncbi:MAG: hypothetical protein GY874_23100 [Desulfobacteraceae bacterium]|nr:hypothetical protein [Desulfobacteraceae bacterium]